jgi:hypothetical protein
MPRTGSFIASFSSEIACLNECVAGFVATSSNSSTQICGPECPEGQYCPPRTVTPIDCQPGTKQHVPGARTIDSCIPVRLGGSNDARSTALSYVAASLTRFHPRGESATCAVLTRHIQRGQRQH